MNKKVLIILVLFLISGIGAYFFINSSKTSVRNPLGGNPTKEDPNKPQLPKKDVRNPITGVLYTTEESKAWSNLRPLAVMVNNFTDARPQSALVKADIIYEVVAEGGITRFVAFFLTETPHKIGPVRSTREYYLILVKEFGDAMLMHIGGSPQAFDAIKSWPVKSLAQQGADFWRDNPRNVATEHTAYVSGVELRKLGETLGWNTKKDFDVWKFVDDEKAASELYADAPTTKKLTVDFWYPGDYTANWKYDEQNNVYLRYTGLDSNDNPIPHVDQETRAQIKVKTVIVQFAKEVSIAGDEKHRLDYDIIGSGDGLIFMNGKVIKATWSKSMRDGRTKFYVNGKEAEFAPGKFWISIVPDRSVDMVVYDGSTSQPNPSTSP